MPVNRLTKVLRIIKYKRFRDQLGIELWLEKEEGIPEGGLKLLDWYDVDNFLGIISREVNIIGYLQ